MLAVVALGAMACASEPGAEVVPDAGEVASDTVASAPAPVDDPTDTATWTIGPSSAPADVGARPLPILSAPRTDTHSDYERMTLEVAAEAGGRPGYRIEYIDRPLIECGSGNQIFPVGDAWLELRLEPAAAHTEEGRPTLAEREVAVDGPLLLRIYRTCNFEGIVTHVLALASPNPYRVVTLADPRRIVVDVRR